MKYKVINPLSLNVQQLTASLLDQYQAYFTTNDPETLAKEFWEKIKAEPKYVYTLDVIFFLINTGCLLEDEKEFEKFLKLIEKNTSLQDVISDVLQKQPLEEDWPELTELQLSSKFTSDALRVFLKQIKDGRESAIETLITFFFKECNFIVFDKYCPSLINKLNDVNLGRLLTTNDSAVILLASKRFSQRCAVILKPESLFKIFSLNIKQEKRKEFTTTLLDFCLKYKKGFLSVFFAKITQIKDVEVAAQIDTIKTNLSSLGESLLKFFQTHPEFFMSYFGTARDFVNLLIQSSNPIMVLSSIIREKFIAKWIARNITSISAALFRMMPEKKHEEILRFLAKNPGSYPTFNEFLLYSIKPMLSQIDSYTSLGIADIFQLALHPIIRKKLNFQEKIREYLGQTRFGTLVDRLITEDEALWEFYVNSLWKEVIINKYNFPLIEARRSVALKVDPIISLSSLEKNLSPLEAFTLADTNEWQCVRKYLNNQANSEPVTNPILKIRMRQLEGTVPNNFRSDTINFLLTQEGLACLVASYEYIDILVFFGSGEQIIHGLEALFIRRTQLHGKEKTNLLCNLEYFINKIIKNYYVLNKTISSITTSNLLGIIEIFMREELLRFLDFKIFIESLLLQPVPIQLNIIKKIVDKKMTKHLFLESQEHGYSYLLINLLDANEIIESLFSQLTEEDLCELLDSVTSVLVLKFIFESYACAWLLPKLISIIINYGQYIANPKFWGYVISHEKLIKSVAANLSYEQFVALLSSQESNSLKQVVFTYIDLFPINKLLRDEKNLISVLCKNEKFGEIFFTSWLRFYEAHLLPEELFYHLFKPENEMVLDYYYNKNISHFLAMLSAVVTALDPKLRDKIKEKYPNIPSQPVSHKMEIDVLHSSKSILSQKTYADVCHYIDLHGAKAEKLKGLHLLLTESLLEGLERLQSEILLRQIPFTVEYVPISLLLTDKFHQFLDHLISSENRKLLDDYLLSLPRDFYLGFHYLIEEPTDINQVAYVKIICRLKELMLKYLIFRATELEKNQDAIASYSFLNILYLCAENCPNQINAFLCQEAFAEKVIRCLKYVGEKQIFGCEGELVVKLSLLKLNLSVPSQGDSDYYNYVILQSLLVQTTVLTGRRAEYIKGLFDPHYLLQLKNIALVGYFLRLPFYGSKLCNEDLMRLVGLCPSLRYGLLFYPHHYNKLSQQNLLASLYAPENIPLIEFSNEHVLLTPLRNKLALEKIATGVPASTSQFFPMINSPKSKYSPEDNFKVEDRRLAKCLEANLLLSFLTSCLPLIFKINEAHPLRSRLEIMEYLIFLVVEQNPEPSVEHRLKSLQRLLPEDSTKYITINQVELWRKEFSTKHLEDPKKIIVSELKELLDGQIEANVESPHVVSMSQV